MTSLQPHIRAIYGVTAVFIMLVFLQTMSYRFSMALGDMMYIFGTVALAMLSVLYGARWQGLAFPGMISMCLTFGLVSVFTSVCWMVRRMLFDIQSSFDQSELRDEIILFVILPLALASIVLPPVIRLWRGNETLKTADPVS